MYYGKLTSHAIIRKSLTELADQDEKDSFRVVSKVSLHNRSHMTGYNGCVFTFSCC